MLYKPIQGYTQLYKAIQGYTELYTAIQGYTQVYTPIQTYTGLYTAIQGYTQLYTGCRCGVGRKRKAAGDPQASHKSCQDGLRKSNCPCVAGGIGCTDVCRCFNCGNIVQARADSGKNPKRKKRNRVTVSPYKRKKGSLFMISQNAEVDYGPWRNIETLCLMVCRDVLLSQRISINSKNLHDLYDFVSPAVVDMSLNIAAKSTV